MTADKHHLSDVIMGAGIGLVAGRSATVGVAGQRFAVGVAPVPEAAAAVAKAVQRVKGTLEPVRAARTFSNFCESAASPESLYGPSLERLRAVRDRYDPQRIMRAHQPLG